MASTHKWQRLFAGSTLAAVFAAGCGASTPPAAPQHSATGVAQTPPEAKAPRLPLGLEPVPPEGHLARVNCLAFSPDGRFLVSGSNDATLLLWEVATRAVVKRFVGHRGFVSACAFLPSGAIVSGGWGGEVWVWDVDSGERVRKLEGLGAVDSVYSLGVRADGRELMAGSSYGKVGVWDPETGQARPFKNELAVSHGKQATVWAAGYLSNGTPFAGSERGKTLLWGPSTRSFDFLPTSGVPLPGGRLLLGGKTGVFVVEPGGQPKLWGAHNDFVYGMSVSPSGDLVLAGDNSGTLRIWKVRGGTAECSMSLPSGLWATAFSPRGDQFAVAGDDGVVRLGSTASCIDGRALQPAKLTSLAADRGRVNAVAAGNALWLGDSNGRVSAWSLATWVRDALAPAKSIHAAEVSTLAALPGGGWVSGGLDFKVYLNVSDTPKELGTARNVIMAAAATGGGTSLLTADMAGDLTLWPRDGGAPQKLLRVGTQLMAVAVHPKEPWALAGGAIGKVFKVPLDGGAVSEWPDEDGRQGTTALLFLPDGRYVQGRTRGDVLLRGDAAVHARLGGLHDSVNGLAWARDSGGVLHVWAGGGDGKLVRWSVDSASREDRTLVRWSVHPDSLFPDQVPIDEGSKIGNIAVTPDRRYLVSTLYDGRASVRALPDGKLVAHLYPFADGSGATVFADGRFHVTGRLAASLRLQDPKTRRVVTLGDALKPSFGAVAVASLPDGSAEVRTTVFSPSGPPTVMLDGQWPVPSVVPSASVLMAYDVTLQLDSPLGGRYSLTATLPEGPDLSVPFSIAPNARFSPESTRALIVGNSNYSTGPLAGVANDLRGMEQWLRERPEGWKLPAAQVEIQTDRNAAQLREDVARFFDSAKAGETLLFYFAGHGDAVDREGYLLPVDANPGQVGSALSATELWTMIRSSKAERILVVLDACRAAKFVVPEAVEREIRESHKVAFLTATSLGAKGSSAGGAFTQALLSMLGREDKVDRRFFAVTAQRAFYGAADRVPEQYPVVWGAPEVLDLPLSWPMPRQQVSAAVQGTGASGGALAWAKAEVATGERMLGVGATTDEERNLNIEVLFDEDTDSLQVSLYQPLDRFPDGPPKPVKIILPDEKQRVFRKGKRKRTTLWKLGKKPAVVEVRPCKRGVKVCDGIPQRLEVK